MTEHSDMSYFGNQQKADQFAAVVAGLADSAMSPSESLEHFLMTVPESAYDADILLQEKCEDLGVHSAEELAHLLEPLIAHHLREFGGKEILGT